MRSQSLILICNIIPRQCAVLEQRGDVPREHLRHGDELIRRLAKKRVGVPLRQGAVPRAGPLRHNFKGHHGQTLRHEQTARPADERRGRRCQRPEHGHQAPWRRWRVVQDE